MAPDGDFRGGALLFAVGAPGFGRGDLAGAPGTCAGRLTGTDAPFASDPDSGAILEGGHTPDGNPLHRYWRSAPKPRLCASLAPLAERAFRAVDRLVSRAGTEVAPTQPSA